MNLLPCHFNQVWWVLVFPGSEDDILGLDLSKTLVITPAQTLVYCYGLSHKISTYYATTSKLVLLIRLGSL